MKKFLVVRLDFIGQIKNRTPNSPTRANALDWGGSGALFPVVFGVLDYVRDAGGRGEDSETMYTFPHPNLDNAMSIIPFKGTGNGLSH